MMGILIGERGVVLLLVIVSALRLIAVAVSVVETPGMFNSVSKGRGQSWIQMLLL